MSPTSYILVLRSFAPKIAVGLGYTRGFHVKMNMQGHIAAESDERGFGEKPLVA